MPLRVAGIGELLWDLLPAGRQLGGAPANFTYHAHTLGADAHVVSRVGDDDLGREALERLRRLGLATAAIATDPVAPTGTVSVELQPDGQPRFTIHEHVAWDHLVASAETLELLGAVDAVCFGTLAQRTPPAAAAVQALVQASPNRALRVFDLNLRQHFHSPQVIRQSLELATVLKLNDEELPVLARQLNLSGSVRDQLTALIERFDLKVVALTRGAHGSVLAGPGRYTEHPGQPVTVRDTVGAGDAFTAALTLALLSGWSFEETGALANQLARHVCAHAGATPPPPPELTGRFV